MNRRIVYISSLPYSGSTLLGILLSSHPRLVGLGEIQGVINKGINIQRICTCGASAGKCPIWGNVVRELSTHPDMPTELVYQYLFDNVESTYSKDHLLVDSSKHRKALKNILKFNHVDAAVIYLIKDVRNWVCSCQEKADRRELERYANLDRRRGLARRCSIYSRIRRTWRWYAENKAMLEHLKRIDPDFIQIGYEELCFSTTNILADVTNFLNIEPFANGTHFTNPKTHILRGNKMRFDRSRNSSIQYDNQWYFSPATQLITQLIPFVMQWNNRNVYSHTSVQ